MRALLDSHAFQSVPASFAADLPGGRRLELAPVPFSVLDPRVLALWGQGFGSFGSTRTDGNAGTLTRDTGGFIIGADATLDGTWRFGLAGGFSRQSGPEVRDFDPRYYPARSPKL